MYKQLGQSRLRSSTANRLYTPLKRLLRGASPSGQKHLALKDAEKRSVISNKSLLLNQNISARILDSTYLPAEIALKKSVRYPDQLRQKAYTIVEANNLQLSPLNQEEFAQTFLSNQIEQIVYQYQVPVQQELQNKQQEIVFTFGYLTGNTFQSFREKQKKAKILQEIKLRIKKQSNQYTGKKYEQQKNNNNDKNIKKYEQQRNNNDDKNKNEVKYNNENRNKNKIKNSFLNTQANKKISLELTIKKQPIPLLKRDELYFHPKVNFNYGTNQSYKFYGPLHQCKPLFSTEKTITFDNKFQSQHSIIDKNSFTTYEKTKIGLQKENSPSLESPLLNKSFNTVPINKNKFYQQIIHSDYINSFQPLKQYETTNKQLYQKKIEKQKKQQRQKKKLSQFILPIQQYNNQHQYKKSKQQNKKQQQIKLSQTFRNKIASLPQKFPQVIDKSSSLRAFTPIKLDNYKRSVVNTKDNLQTTCNKSSLEAQNAIKKEKYFTGDRNSQNKSAMSKPIKQYAFEEISITNKKLPNELNLYNMLDAQANGVQTKCNFDFFARTLK